MCYCGDSGLYHGDWCEIKHNVSGRHNAHITMAVTRSGQDARSLHNTSSLQVLWNMSLAWFIIASGLFALVYIFGHGGLANRSTDLQEYLLRIVLQKTRPTVKLEYPRGSKKGDELFFVDETEEVSDLSAEAKSRRPSNITKRASLTSLNDSEGPRVASRSDAELSMAKLTALAPEYTQATLLPRLHAKRCILMVEENTGRLPRHEPIALLPLSSMPSKALYGCGGIIGLFVSIAWSIVWAGAGAVIGTHADGMPLQWSSISSLGFLVGAFSGFAVGLCVLYCCSRPFLESRQEKLRLAKEEKEKGQEDRDKEMRVTTEEEQREARIRRARR